LEFHTEVYLISRGSLSIEMILPPRTKGAKFGSKGKKNGSCLRSTVEFGLFTTWLVFTAMGGYFVGHTPQQKCSVTEPDIIVAQAVRPKCIPNKQTSGPAGMGVGVVRLDGIYLFI
jgi:hypothetical protein